MSKTIFWSIASYDDWDMYQTVSSARANADDWGRVTGMAVFQTNNEAEATPPLPSGGVRLRVMPKAWARGVGRPRNLALKAYRGEDYFLMTDSHMRFNRGWDSDLVKMMEWLSEVGVEKPILTSYAPGIEDYSAVKVGVIELRFVNDFWNPRGIITGTEMFRGAPLPAYYASGHMFFAPGEWAPEVGIDPHFAFSGEEQSMALRSYTRGWDLLHPNYCPIRHEYGTARKRIWDERSDWDSINDASIARLHKLCGWSREGPDLGRWGLGSERSLDDWQEFSGIDLTKRTCPKYHEWAEGARVRFYGDLGLPLEAPMPKATLDYITADIPKGCRDCGKEAP